MTESIKTEPFNPDDPFDIVCDNFRLGILKSFQDADKIALYRELGHRGAEAFIAGTLVGLVGVVIASVRPEKRKEAISGLRDYIEFAVIQNEAMLK